MQAIPIIFDKKESCCGCSACFAICPLKAITMGEDEKGFLYPLIDPALCVDCGLCKEVCPIQNNNYVNENSQEPDVYATKHKSDDVRMNSSSGGVFTAVSDLVLERKGIVYGAAFDDNFKVCHSRADSIIERDRFRGSKYIQSELGNCFQNVREDLINGFLVLFSGTPCQIAGLRSFLRGVETGNLMTLDIVCHGVPSPRVFKDYLGRIKSKFNSNIKEINFRFKSLGWRSQAINISLKNDREYVAVALEDPYYHLFLSNIILRDSCYQCVFANTRRPSDITLGDYWGIEEKIPDFHDDKGISLVLVNSEKGKKIYKSLESVLDFRESDLLSCMQPNLKGPSVASPCMDQFWLDYQRYSFTYILRKYGNLNLISEAKKKIRKFLKHLGLLDQLKRMKHFGYLNHR